MKFSGSFFFLTFLEIFFNCSYITKSMLEISREKIEQIKTKKYRLLDKYRIRDINEAYNFINKLGTVAVYSDKILPNLYDAVYSKEKPRSDGWNWDRIERTWHFALDLAKERKIYYGKLLRKKNILIPIKLFPNFYKLYAKSDYLKEYHDGNLTKTAKDIMQVLSSKTFLSTDDIRASLSFHKKEGTKRLHKGLVELQENGMISCVGSIKGKSNWDVFVWGILKRWLPVEVIERAKILTRDKAVRNLTKQFIDTKTITTLSEIRRFFNLDENEVDGTVAYLLKKRTVSFCSVENKRYLIFKKNWLKEL